jgi:hypothetical protein
MGWLRVDPENLIDRFAPRSQMLEPYRAHHHS